MDHEMLKILLTPDGHRTSQSLSKKLRVPVSTVQRRRKRLETEFLTLTYSMRLERFGWRRVVFLVATERGETKAVARELLKRDDVVYIGRSIGQPTVDLMVETVVKNNSEILDLQEVLKAMKGVREAVWTEIVEVMGRKASIPARIIDTL